MNSLEYSYGNAQSNPLKSGRISKSDWIKGVYGVYCVDLDNAVEDSDDQVSKSLAVQWIVDAPNTVSYDFYLIVECAYKYSVDVINGSLVTGDVYNKMT